MRQILQLGLVLAACTLINLSCGEPPELKWTTFEKIERHRGGERLLFIELYTSWCGWCRRMENYTFNDPIVAKYMNKKFYSIRFNAEDRRPINFLDKSYRFDPTDGKRGRHELAKALMLDSEKQGYPTVVFLDENYNLIQAIPGYISAKDFEAIMHYFGDGAYKTMKWEEFVKKYKISSQGASGLN